MLTSSFDFSTVPDFTAPFVLAAVWNDSKYKCILLSDCSEMEEKEREKDSDKLTRDARGRVLKKHQDKRDSSQFQVICMTSSSTLSRKAFVITTKKIIVMSTLVDSGKLRTRQTSKQHDTSID